MRSTSGRSIPDAPLPDAGGGGETCLIGNDTVRNWYRGCVKRGSLFEDAAQAEVVEALQGLSDGMCEHLGGAGVNEGKGGVFSWIFSNGGKGRAGDPPKGIYIHGKVGRGKSFLVDGFFLNLPIQRKLRVHFHGFMRHFHADMKELEGRPDALERVAGKLASGYDLICLDEFHVNDIADAMIIGRMLEVLLESGAVLVATSNYEPDGLYPNGLARDRFLPAIALIKERLEVLSLDGDTDYRLRALQDAGLYLTPRSDENSERFSRLFDSLAVGMTLRPSVRVSGRELRARKRTSDALWLEFSEVCGGNYGRSDYLALAERFTTVFVSGVPRLGTEEQAESTRRFTWLVDVLYDTRVKLVLLADEPLDGLFAGEGGESGRTLSRLEEMQSREYLEETVRESPEVS